MSIDELFKKDMHMYTKFNIYIRGEDLVLELLREKTSLQELIEDLYPFLRDLLPHLNNNSSVKELVAGLEVQHGKQILLEKDDYFVRAVSVIRPELKFKVPEYFLWEKFVSDKLLSSK